MSINFQMKSLTLKYKTDKIYKRTHHLLAIISLITFLTIIFTKTKDGVVHGERFKWFFQGIKLRVNFWNCFKFIVRNKS